MRVFFQIIERSGEFLQLTERQRSQFVAGLAVERQFNHPTLNLPRKRLSFELVHANGSFATLEGVIPIPAQFSRERDLARDALPVSPQDPSLRMKNGFGQDDAGKIGVSCRNSLHGLLHVIHVLDFILHAGGN